MEIILMIYIINPNKVTLIERVIRTIYEKLEKRFDFTGKKEWVKNLPKLTEEYNNTIHSTIKTTPKKQVIVQIVLDFY